MVFLDNLRLILRFMRVRVSFEVVGERCSIRSSYWPRKGRLGPYG